MFGKTKKVLIGNVAVGADFPVAVQSMTNTDTLDVVAGTNYVRVIVQSGTAAPYIALVKFA